MPPKLADIATFNGSGRPQMRAALDHCRQGRFVGPGNGATIVLVATLVSQETQARGDAWVDLKATAKRVVWNTVGNPAASAHSAGVAISTRTSYLTGKAQWAKEDISPSESPGRLATTWVDGILRGGVQLILVYL